MCCNRKKVIVVKLHPGQKAVVICKKKKKHRHDHWKFY